MWQREDVSGVDGSVCEGWGDERGERADTVCVPDVWPVPDVWKGGVVWGSALAVSDTVLGDVPESEVKSETWIVCPDTHVAPVGSVEGGIDPRADSVLKQAIRIVRPDGFVHIGDVGEWESASHWQWTKRKRPPFEFMKPLIMADVRAVNKWLDEIDRELDKAGTTKRMVTEGNHEVWCDNFAIEEARPEFGAKALMRIKERGWEWHEHGEFAKIGKLNLTHGGHFTGLHHAYKTVLGLSASCMYGHFHNVESAHVMHLGGAHGAWAIGCLCKMRKKFLGGKPTSWSHAFGIVHVEANGQFHVEVVDIFDGVAYVYGRRVEAK